MAMTYKLGEGTIENVISCNRYKEKDVQFLCSKRGNAGLLQLLCHSILRLAIRKSKFGLHFG